jgi:hypothetical protein
LLTLATSIAGLSKDRYFLLQSKFAYRHIFYYGYNCDMSHIYDQYRMVKTVNKESIRLEKLEPQPISEHGFEVWHPATSNVKKRFMKHRPWWKPSEAAHIVADCIEDDYLLGSTTVLSFGEKFDTICLKKKGRKLIQKTLFIFPTGLWKAWYEEDGKVFIAFAGGLIALLGATVGLLVKDTLIYLWNLFS